LIPQGQKQTYRARRTKRSCRKPLFRKRGAKNLWSSVNCSEKLQKRGGASSNSRGRGKGQASGGTIQRITASRQWAGGRKAIRKRKRPYLNLKGNTCRTTGSGGGLGREKGKSHMLLSKVCSRWRIACGDRLCLLQNEQAWGKLSSSGKQERGGLNNKSCARQEGAGSYGKETRPHLNLRRPGGTESWANKGSEPLLRKKSASKRGEAADTKIPKSRSSS